MDIKFYFIVHSIIFYEEKVALHSPSCLPSPSSLILLLLGKKLGRLRHKTHTFLTQFPQLNGESEISTRKKKPPDQQQAMQFLGMKKCIYEDLVVVGTLKRS
jgi:hypothetical protein